MAQGTGFLAEGAPASPNPTSNITPSYSVPDMGAPARALGDTFDKLGELFQPALNQDAQTIGQREGADAAAHPGSVRRSPLSIGEAGAARTAGFKAGYLAQMHNDIDARADDLEGAHAYDPEGFAAAAQTATSTFIQGAPDDLAIDVENYAQRKFAETHLKVADRTEQKQTEAAYKGLNDRLTMLRGQIRGIAHDGGVGTPDYAAKMGEVDDILNHMVANPAFAVPPEFAVKSKDDLLADVGSASMAGHVAQTYRTQGYDAALKELRSLQTDTSIPAEIREKGAAAASAELEQAHTLDSQITNNANALTAQAQKSMQARIDEDVATAALTGQGDATLTQDVVRPVLGNDGVRDWLTKRAKAFQDYQDYGDLSRLSPAAAAQRMAEINARHQASGGTGSVAPGFDAAVNFVIDQNEGGDAFVPNDNGRGPTKFGINASANPGVDIANLTRAQATAIYKHNYWDAIDGDHLPPALALAAFDAAVNQGVGNAKKWLAQSGGDVTKFMALRQQGYANLLHDPAQQHNATAWNDRMGKVANQVIGLTGGDSNPNAWAAWDQANEQRRTDPAAAVSGDPFVIAQVQKWQGDTHAGNLYSGSGFSAAQAFYDAQTRAGIKPKDQKPLPNASLAKYADDYLKTVQAGDPATVITWGKNLMRQFDDPIHPGHSHGHQVFQAVLEQAGASPIAAQVAAGAVDRARNGVAASAQDRAALAVSPRADAMHHAANGTGAGSSVIPPEAAGILRASPTAARRQQFDVTFGAGASARVLGN